MKKILFVFIYSPLLLFSQEKVKLENYFDNLTIEERRIMVQKGTEKSGSGIYNQHFEEGIYICKACNNPLFRSQAKF